MSIKTCTTKTHWKERERERAEGGVGSESKGVAVAHKNVF